MNNSHTTRANDWIFQAQDDLAWAEETIASKRYAQACFVAQQAAEKALKGLAIDRELIFSRGHSVSALAKSLALGDDLIQCSRYLDRYYISARYPDAYPEGYPSQYIEQDDAERALTSARTLISYVVEAVTPSSSRYKNED